MFASFQCWHSGSGDTFVVFEGVDGSGKSTQARLLIDYFEQRGLRVINRAHPSTDNFFGRMAKKNLLGHGGLAKVSTAFFYIFDVLRSTALYHGRSGYVKVFERYLLGTAYLPRPLHRVAYDFFAFTLPTSDLMFVLDVSPAEAFRRIGKRNSDVEMFESSGELARKRDRMLELACTHNWVIINADGGEKSVHARIRRIIEEHAFNHRR